MKLDEILEKLGEFGTYQKRVFILLALPSISIGSFCFLPIVLLFTPDHRCKVPGLENDTYALQDRLHASYVNNTIPLSRDPLIYYERCHVYDVDTIGGDEHGHMSNTSMTSCGEWVYDTSIFKETFTSKIDLVCNDSLKTSHIQMFFYFGLLVGDFVFGLLADILGRKKSLCLSLVLTMISSICVTFAPEFYSFGILEFMIGGCAHGAFICIAVLSVEIVGPSKRVMMGTFMQIFFAIGGIYLATVSYFVRDWRWISLACAIPCLFYLTYWWFVQESPRWLLSQGRHMETEVIIKNIASANKQELAESPMFDHSEKEDHAESHGNMWQLIRSPIMLKRTLILSFAWTIVSMTYYGVTMNAGNLGGSFYLNFLLMGVAELPGYVIVILLLDKIGRRWCNGGSLILCGIACIATVPTVLVEAAGMQELTIVLALIGKAGASAAFAVVFIFTGELLPTVVRNVGMGVCSCAARVGAMLAPYIAKTGELIGGKFGQVEPLVVFGALSIVAGCLLFLLPETHNKTLPDTIKQGEQFGRKPSTERAKTFEADTESPFLVKSGS